MNTKIQVIIQPLKRLEAIPFRPWSSGKRNHCSLLPDWLLVLIQFIIVWNQQISKSKLELWFSMKHPCFITVIQWDSWSTCLWWYHWMYRKSNVVLRFIHNVETIVTYHSNMLSDDSTTLRRPDTCTMFSFIISNKQKERWNIYTLHMNKI